MHAAEGRGCERLVGVPGCVSNVEGPGCVCPVEGRGCVCTVEGPGCVCSVWVSSSVDMAVLLSPGLLRTLQLLDMTTGGGLTGRGRGWQA